MKTIASIILCLCFAGNAVAAEDWAYELSAEAKQIYRKKIVQYPCKKIPTLLDQSMSPEFKQTQTGLTLVPVQNEKTDEIYFTIRDAGLFRTKSCESYIKQHISRLNELPGVKAAIAFYFYRMGDKQQLNNLIADFDKASSDDFAVELFGFLDDWNVSGVRLVRLAAHADASGAELLCSSIMWRRYLYGEKIFKDNWYSVGKNEKVDKRRLDHFFETCRVEP
jgi:hypothetical protein